MQDDRIIRENGVEAKVASLAIPVLDAIGYRLVRVLLSGREGLTLQIMAERPDGSMTVEDCEAVTHAISPMLDVEDPIDRSYQLEVSSPGIDRPLVRRADFEDAAGHLAKVETSILLDGRKRFRGQIAECSKEAVALDLERAADDEPARATIPFDAISEAKLVLTDTLIRDALKKDKEERRQRKKARRKSDTAEDENVEDED